MQGANPANTGWTSWAIPNRIKDIRTIIRFQELRCNECQDDLYIIAVPMFRIVHQRLQCIWDFCLASTRIRP